MVICPIRLYRHGIATGLNSGGVEVRGSAHDLADALPLIDRTRPDVAVMDLNVTGGLQAVRELTLCRVQVVVVGVEETADRIIPWAEAGAAGYVGQDADIASLVRVVRSVLKRELLCDATLAAALWRRLGALAAAVPEGEQHGLTGRESEVAALLGLGLSNKQIAARLHVESATVKNHVQSVLRKTGCHRRSDVASALRATAR